MVFIIVGIRAKGILRAKRVIWMLQDGHIVIRAVVVFVILTQIVVVLWRGGGVIGLSVVGIVMGFGV